MQDIKHEVGKVFYLPTLALKELVQSAERRNINCKAFLESIPKQSNYRFHVPSVLHVPLLWCQKEFHQVYSLPFPQSYYPFKVHFSLPNLSLDCELGLSTEQYNWVTKHREGKNHELSLHKVKKLLQNNGFKQEVVAMTESLSGTIFVNVIDQPREIRRNVLASGVYIQAGFNNIVLVEEGGIAALKYVS